MLGEIIHDSSQHILQTPFPINFSVVEEVWLKAAKMIGDSCIIKNSKTFYDALIKKYQTALRSRTFKSFQNNLHLPILSFIWFLQTYYHSFSKSKEAFCSKNLFPEYSFDNKQ